MSSWSIVTVVGDANSASLSRLERALEYLGLGLILQNHIFHYSHDMPAGLHRSHIGVINNTRSSHNWAGVCPVLQQIDVDIGIPEDYSTISCAMRH